MFIKYVCTHTHIYTIYAIGDRQLGNQYPLLIIIPFLLIRVVCNLRDFILYVTISFVDTLVKCFGYLSNI